VYPTKLPHRASKFNWDCFMTTTLTLGQTTASTAHPLHSAIAVLARGATYRGKPRSPWWHQVAPAIILSIGVHTAARANLTTTDDAPPPVGQLQDVIVTARKLSEDIQTTGLSMAAFTRADLDSLHITTATDLANFTPNLELKASGGSAAQGLEVKIRGIGVSDVQFDTQDPSVGMYIDGVFIGRAFGPQFYLFDLDRVEVLRGPQGSLYGQNSLGGAVNFITRKPDGRDTLEFDAGGGNYGALNLSAHAGTTLIDQYLFATFAAFSRTHDGYTKNVYESGNDPSDENVHGARVALRWLASDHLTADLTADYSEQHQHAWAFFATAILPNGLSAAGITAAGDQPARYAVGTNPSASAISSISQDNSASGGSFLPTGIGDRGRSADDATFKGVSLTVAADITPVIVVKSISGYRTFDRFYATDLDGSPAAILDEVKSDNGDQITEEVQLISKLFDGHLEMLVGGFFLHEQMYEDESNGFLLGLADTDPALQGLSTQNLHTYDNRSEAGFMHAIGRLTDRTRIVAGIRYTDETKSTHFNDGELISPRLFSTLNEADTLRFNATTPTLGIEHDATKNMFVYATLSKGFASGGYNETPDATTGRISTYKPETLWNYEVGYKSTWLDRRLRFNAAAFLMNYDNIVINTFGQSSNNGGIGLETANAGRARVTGCEAELQWYLAPTLELVASLGELDQKYLDYGIGSDGLPIPPQTAHFFDAPKTTNHLGMYYTFPSNPSSGTFHVGADWAHRSRTWFDNDNTPASSQESYSLFSARLRYAMPNNRTTLTAYGENLGNRVYAVSSANLLTTAFGTALAAFGAPRTFGLELNYRL